MNEIKRPSMHALKKAGLLGRGILPRNAETDPGLYEMFQESTGKWVPVEIFFNANINRRTGEEELEWLAIVDGETVPAYEDIWSNCCARPISREQYEAMLKEAETSETVTRIDFIRS